MSRLYFLLLLLTDFCVENNEELDAVSQILAYSYKLHECHQTAQATKLYDLMIDLLNVGWDRNPTVEAVLRFLVNLAGEVQISSWDTSTKVGISPAWNMNCDFCFIFSCIYKVLETRR
jgi:hypothetical protein